MLLKCATTPKVKWDSRGDKVVGERRGTGGGEERVSEGGRGKAGAGQVCDEIEVERRQRPRYANIKVMM